LVRGGSSQSRKNIFTLRTGGKWGVLFRKKKKKLQRGCQFFFSGHEKGERVGGKNPGHERIGTKRGRQSCHWEIIIGK